MPTKQQLLKDVFGHDSFRDGQESLIDALLSGRDALGIMPTGSGKSVCFQLPALLLPGVTLVISPLISLMKDQVSALRLNGVPAAYINTSLTAQQQRLAIQRAQEGQYKLIYVAPERLDTPAFRQLCQTIPVSLVAVDEAHCVSQWGQDFRPDYLRIADFIAVLPHRPPVGAFTATATARVSQDIVQYLGLRDPVRVTTGFDRPNLFFEVIPVTRKRGEVLLDALSRLEGQSGIVYCATRKNTESVCELLRSHGYAAAAYHAGLEDADRKQAQEDFQYDRIQIIVATNAFGMGIDKSNVRFVIHYNMPKSIEAYYQEAGRAGRDGDDAVCLLLFGKSDIVTARQLIYHSSNPDLPPETATQVRQADLDRLRAMTSYAESTTCYRARLLHYFGQSAPAVCSGCSRCLPTRFPDARLTAEDAGLTRAERKARKAAELAEAAGSPAPVSAASSAELTPFATALFERLRKGRSEIAQGLGLPAYLICDDRCLKDMAVKQPRTREELLNVFGIGRRKADQFGDDFLRMVAEGLAAQSTPAQSIEKKENAAMRLTTLCYIEREGKYLMLHRVKKAQDENAGKWIGIGGHLLAHESPEECVRREVLEETGLTLTGLRMRGVITFILPDWGDELTFLYTAQAEGEVKPDCPEGVLRWVPVGEVERLPLWEGDHLFLPLLRTRQDCFSMKLIYAPGGALVDHTLM